MRDIFWNSSIRRLRRCEFVLSWVNWTDYTLHFHCRTAATSLPVVSGLHVEVKEQNRLVWCWIPQAPTALCTDRLASPHHSLHIIPAPTPNPMLWTFLHLLKLLLCLTPLLHLTVAVNKDRHELNLWQNCISFQIFAIRLYKRHKQWYIESSHDFQWKIENVHESSATSVEKLHRYKSLKSTNYSGVKF